MEGRWGGSQVNHSDSVQREGVCSLIAVPSIELLLPGVEGKAPEFQEGRVIPGKPWNSSQEPAAQ